MKKRILAAVAALVSCVGAAFAAGDWSVTLDGFDPSKKVAVIKAVRTALGAQPDGLEEARGERACVREGRP